MACDDSRQADYKTILMIGRGLLDHTGCLVVASMAPARRHPDIKEFVL